MNDTRVSFGQIKRDISDIVNRVTYGGERIILTSLQVEIAPAIGITCSI
jgi:hypothetical protein